MSYLIEQEVVLFICPKIKWNVALTKIIAIWTSGKSLLGHLTPNLMGHFHMPRFFNISPFFWFLTHWTTQNMVCIDPNEIFHQRFAQKWHDVKNHICLVKIGMTGCTYLWFVAVVCFPNPCVKVSTLGVYRVDTVIIDMNTGVSQWYFFYSGHESSSPIGYYCIQSFSMCVLNKLWILNMLWEVISCLLDLYQRCRLGIHKSSYRTAWWVPLHFNIVKSQLCHSTLWSHGRSDGTVLCYLAATTAPRIVSEGSIREKSD